MLGVCCTPKAVHEHVISWDKQQSVEVSLHEIKNIAKLEVHTEDSKQDKNSKFVATVYQLGSPRITNPLFDFVTGLFG